ncbi:MAG TPA: hypothetical protein VE935_01015 [Burkholderiales bacterium]|nr:hypothetical protein [Burkholderiales bacterium]
MALAVKPPKHLKWILVKPLSMASDTMNTISTSQILRVAAETVGGWQALARCLGCPLAELQAWIEGDGAAPFAVALRAAQIASQAQRPSSPSLDARSIAA